MLVGELSVKTRFWARGNPPAKLLAGNQAVGQCTMTFIQKNFLPLARPFSKRAGDRADARAGVPSCV